MSLPGFPNGGGPSNFFGSAANFSGRSITLQSTMNNNINNNNFSNTTTTTTHNLNPYYITQQQVPSIFLDPSSQIAQRQTQAQIGKRTLAEFQTQNINNNNLNHHNFNYNYNNNNLNHQNFNLNHNNTNNSNIVFSNLLLRSVKQRNFQHGSPISPLSPIDFRNFSPELSNSSNLPSPRFGMPLRSNPIVQNPLSINNTILQNPMIQNPLSMNNSNNSILQNPMVQNPLSMNNSNNLILQNSMVQNPLSMNNPNNAILQNSMVQNPLSMNNPNNLILQNPMVQNPLSMNNSILQNSIAQNPISINNSTLRNPIFQNPLPMNSTSILQNSIVQNPLLMNNPILQNTNLVYQNSNFTPIENKVMTNNPDPQKKMMDDRLQELEKQLLEDNDYNEVDEPASAVTNNEWSETIQNLINIGQNPTQIPVSSSPTSSLNSSSSSTVFSAGFDSSKQLLMETATAISEGKNEVALEILNRLAQLQNLMVNSDRRLMDYIVSALKSRMNKVENPPLIVELFSKEHAESTHLLFEHSLCFKFAFMAANFAILEAAFDETTTENDNNNEMKLCVVDFDIGNGKQYVNLLHELYARLNGSPATLKITTVADNDDEERLKMVGEMLGHEAECLKIGFEFKVVNLNITELTRESLGCDSEDFLAVNFAFKLFRMPDESVSTENPRDELLRRVKALTPRVVIVLEQEINTNTAPFVARVGESCSYYNALFDSIESNLAREDMERMKIEEGLSRKLSNAIACEGRERVERCEVFGKWRARMSMAGFRLNPMSQKVAESIKNRLAPGSRVTVKDENGGVCFGWMGRTLTVGSAWH